MPTLMLLKTLKLSPRQWEHCPVSVHNEAEYIMLSLPFTCYAPHMTHTLWQDLTTYTLQKSVCMNHHVSVKNVYY